MTMSNLKKTGKRTGIHNEITSEKSEMLDLQTRGEDPYIRERKKLYDANCNVKVGGKRSNGRR